MRKILTNYFYYSKSERNGVTVLVFLILGIWVTSRFFSNNKAAKAIDYSAFEPEILAFHNSLISSDDEDNFSQASTNSLLFPFNPNTATIEDFVKLGLSNKVATTITHYREKGGQFRRKEDFKKIYGLKDADYKRLEPYIQMGEESISSMKYPYLNKRDTPQYNIPHEVKLMPFDPNTADEMTLLSLGLDRNIVKNVLKYRSAGGKFYKKEDFKKLYGLSEIDFLRLENYIQISDSQKNTNYNFGKSSNLAASKAQPEVIDLNSATKDDLLRLRGIGSTFAARILEQREKLGGFATLEQLKDVYGLPDSTYHSITPFLKLLTPIYRKLSVNKVNIETASHPYLNRRQIEVIVRYRLNHGNFKSIDDLRKTGVFTEATLDKLKLYLIFD